MRVRSTVRLFSAVFVVTVAMLAAVTTAQNATWWPFAGQNLFNTHSHPQEDQISAANAPLLVEKWRLTTAGNVTATPTVYQGVRYVPDMGGKLWAVTAGSGKVRWSHSISSYTGIENDVSRTSPAIVGNAMILGDGWIRQQCNCGGACVRRRSAVGKPVVEDESPRAHCGDRDRLTGRAQRRRVRRHLRQRRKPGLEQRATSAASVVPTSTLERPPICSRRRIRPPAARVRSWASARRVAITGRSTPTTARLSGARRSVSADWAAGSS